MSTSNYATRLSDITPEDRPERLIELIQNLAGSVPKEERQEALHVLIKRFDKLINKIIRGLYFDEFKIHQYAYDLVDFTQDTLTEFCNLTLYDFKIKEDLDDPNLAVFANYIKNKLYWRMKHWVQERERKSSWGREDGVDYDLLVSTSHDYTRTYSWEAWGAINGRRALDREVQKVLLSNVLNYDDLVLDDMMDDEARSVLNEMIDISNQKLDERDRKVWYLTFFTGMKVEEIAAAVVSKIDGKPIGRSRVTQISKRANEVILSELGRRVGMRRAGL